MSDFTLFDQFERQTNYLRLSVTDLCNFKCSYCLPHGYRGKVQQQEISLEEITCIAEASAKAGITKIRITGGEPTLRQDLTDIIQICKTTPGIEKVVMTTNGYRLKERIQSWFDSGLDVLTISMDGFDQPSFLKATGYDGYNNIQQGLSIAVSKGYPMKINRVYQGQGEMLNETMDFVTNNEVDVRLIQLMQTQENTTVFAREHPSLHTLENYLCDHQWQLNSQNSTDGPARLYSHEKAQGRIGFITPYEDTFCNSCNRIRITALGKLHLCLFDSVAFDLRQIMTSPTALTDALQTYIHQKPKQHQLQSQDPGLITNLAMIGG